MPVSTKGIVVSSGALVSVAGLVYLALPQLTGPSAGDTEARRVRLLEERLNTLQARLQRAQPSPGDSAGAVSAKQLPGQSAPEELERAQEESKKRHIEAHERALRLHATQPVDDSWAPQASEAFRADLHASRSQTGAQVLSVDCRTNSCVARLEWPSFHEARRGFSPVLHSHYRVNCIKTVTLPEPGDPSRPYIGSAIFLECQKTSARK